MKHIKLFIFSLLSSLVLAITLGLNCSTATTGTNSSSDGAGINGSLSLNINIADLNGQHRFWAKVFKGKTLVALSPNTAFLYDGKAKIIMQGLTDNLKPSSVSAYLSPSNYTVYAYYDSNKDNELLAGDGGSKKTIKLNGDTTLSFSTDDFADTLSGQVELGDNFLASNCKPVYCYFLASGGNFKNADEIISTSYSPGARFDGTKTIMEHTAALVKGTYDVSCHFDVDGDGTFSYGDYSAKKTDVSISETAIAFESGSFTLHSPTTEPDISVALAGQDKTDVLDARAIEVRGNTAYIADGASKKFVALDISDKAAINLLASYTTTGNTTSAYLCGDYAYIGDESDGLSIINIKDSANLALTKKIATGGTINDVFVSGDYAYIAAGAGGLRIVDISNPYKPVDESNITTVGNAMSVVLSGKYAYVAAGTSGLRIIDVSDVSTPVDASNFDTTVSASGVYVDNNIAFIADGTAGGLLAIDVSDPTSLGTTEEGSFNNTTGAALKLYVFGDYVFIADSADGLEIVNIKDISTQSLKTVYKGTTSANVFDLEVHGNYAFLAYESEGLSIVKLVE